MVERRRRVRSVEARIAEEEDKLERLKLQKAIKDMRERVRSRRRTR